MKPTNARSKKNYFVIITQSVNRTSGLKLKRNFLPPSDLIDSQQQYQQKNPSNASTKQLDQAEIK